MTGTAALNISAVLFQEKDGTWSAQCLEYDIAAQAKTVNDLRYELGRVLIVHVAASIEQDQEPFKGLGPAPQKFWDMYSRSDIQVPSKSIPFRLPHPTETPQVIPEMRIA